MLKKRLYTALSIVVCCLTVFSVSGQAISVGEVNITAQTDVVSTNQTVATVVAATGNLTVRANSVSFANSIFGQSDLNLNILKIKAKSIGGVTLGGGTEVSLSIADQTIYTGLGLLGNVNVDYRIPTAGTIWLAGTYNASLIYNVATIPYSILVAAYITPSSTIPASIPIAITTFAPFRAGNGISTSNINMGYNTTVPTQISIRAKSSGSFSFTPSFTSPLTFTPVNSTVLSAALTDPSGATVSVSTTDKNLTVAAGLPVIATNKRPNISTVFTISGADLLTNFKNAGVYKLPITYTIGPTNGFPITTPAKTMDSSVDVTVSNLMDIQLPNSTVALNFDNLNNYTEGVTTGIINQVNVSSTVPYNITVKAGSAAFIKSTDPSSTIPLSVMTIEGMSGQTGVTPITLSATPQAIVTAGNPVIDRQLNLQYRISAANVVSGILGKSNGNYNATIIYTIVAP